MSQKVAIITGGGEYLISLPSHLFLTESVASGIGLAVATHLATTGTWSITILDLNQPAGEAAVASLQSTTFIHTDVNDYASFSSAFHRTFMSHDNQLDFVFANAGIAEKDSFYTHPLSSPNNTDPTSPPPPPNMLP
jgi:NAD(P)-dependent dehydrogenase (short-subunit alcohol dehydrogenase family)